MTKSNLMVAGSAICFALCTSVPALAQASTDQSSASVQDLAGSISEREDEAANAIIVTGSRISRPNYDTIEPVIVVAGDDIEERGFSTLGQALSEQPAFGVPGASAVGGQSSDAPGQNFVDFFSLGSQRTLTLVNARRFVGSNSSSIFGPTGSGGSQVDLNIIPTKLIERVETIAVGGAPIYGSDAIAGTVNIILKRKFQGLELDGQYGVSSKGDAADYRIRGIAGTSFADGRGNVVVTAEYNKSNGLLFSDRELTSQAGFFGDRTDAGEPFRTRIFLNRRIPSISETGVPLVGGEVFGLAFPLSPAQSNLFFDDPTLNFGVNGVDGISQLRFDQNGNLIPINFGNPTGTPRQFRIDFSGGNGFDINSTANLLAELERTNAIALGDYQISDGVRLFAEAWYSRSKGTNLRDQPEYNSALFSGAGTASGNFILSVDNPFLSTAARQSIIDSINNNVLSDQNQGVVVAQDYFYLGRANTDLASGRSVGRSQILRGVLGLDGDFEFNGRKINWEVVGNYGRAETKARNTGLAIQNLFNALDAVDQGVFAGGAANGNIICRPGAPVSGAPTISSTCAPLNPFGSNKASQAARDYVTGISTPTALNEQWVITTSIAGAVADLPGGELAFAAGFEHRNESQKFDPGKFLLGGPDNTPLVDENGDGKLDNDPSSFGGSVPVVANKGSFNTDEVFGEVRADLIGPDQNITLINTLEVKGAIRYVENSFSGGDLTWTVGGRWAPVAGMTFRGNFTRAIRSPSITESVNPNQSSFNFAVDPCDQNQVNNGPNPDTRRLNCIAAGINPLAFNSLSNQRSFPQAVAGEPNLAAEKSNSWTVGALIQPKFLRRLNLSVDYVDIKVKDVITDLSAEQVLSECYDSSNFANNLACKKIKRAADGQLSFIQTGYANQAELRYRGILANVDYTFDTPFLGVDSSVSLGADYQYLDTLSSRAVGGLEENRAGNIGLSQHKALLKANFYNKNFNALVSASYFGKAKYDVFAAPDFQTPNGVGDVVFFNTSFGVNVNDKFQLRLVVDNILNTRPPSPAPIGGGTITYFRGILGRYFRLGATAKF
jgi:iron complex outermembrane recepter protein